MRVLTFLYLFLVPVMGLVPVTTRKSQSTKNGVSMKLPTVKTMLPSAVAAAGVLATPLAAMAEEVEIVELPPPYVPVLFGVALLAGVGVLTSSLGNVMDEGMFKTRAMLVRQQGCSHPNFRLQRLL